MGQFFQAQHAKSPATVAKKSLKYEAKAFVPRAQEDRQQIDYVYEEMEPSGFPGIDYRKHEVIRWILRKSQRIASAP
jgi:hypothetical protein